MAVASAHSPSPDPRPDPGCMCGVWGSAHRLPEGKTELDGRLLLLIATQGEGKPEPRFRVNADGLDTAQVSPRFCSGWHLPPPPPALCVRVAQTFPQVFGLDVEGLKPSESATVDHTVFGAPLVSTADLPPGDYDIQVRRTPCSC